MHHNLNAEHISNIFIFYNHYKKYRATVTPLNRKLSLQISRRTVTTLIHVTSCVRFTTNLLVILCVVRFGQRQIFFSICDGCLEISMLRLFRLLAWRFLEKSKLLSMLFRYRTQDLCVCTRVVASLSIDYKCSSRKL